MAGGGLEKAVQARASRRLARRPLALTGAWRPFAGDVKYLATLRSEKDVGGANSAGIPVWDRGSSAGVEGVLVLANQRSGVRNARWAATIGLAFLCLAGCSQEPARVAYRRQHGHEHFAEGAYGKASPRVIADGGSVPRGGGQYLVGRPYSIHGRMYYPRESDNYVAEGRASWYGDAFHGRKTANGEIYDKMALSAAHPTMPLPSYARVTNLGNGRSIMVRVNDRGPYAAGRVMDVSSRVADVLDFKRMGTAQVKVEYVGRAPLEGSDDNQLLATLRADGAPAEMGGASTLLAEAASPLVSLFGAKSEPPPPAPPPPEPAPRRARAAAPPPPERAEPPERRTEVADAEESSVAPRAAAADAPLPPTRPYNLDRVASATPKPPRRSEANRALYFANPHAGRDDLLARLLRRSPTRPLTEDDDDN